MIALRLSRQAVKTITVGKSPTFGFSQSYALSFSLGLQTRTSSEVPILKGKETEKGRKNMRPMSRLPSAAEARDEDDQKPPSLRGT